jgi:hypothetical protein
MLYERRCRDCKEVKPTEYFGADEDRHDGFAVYCLACMASREAMYSGEKTCTTCGDTKPKHRFNRMLHHSDGLENRCKTCAQAAKRASRKRNPVSAETKRAYANAYRERHAERSRDYGRRRNLAKKFNMSREQYEALLAKQDGKCAICMMPESARNPRTHEVKMLAVDHHHGTSQNRGLLCQSCNTAIGLMGESAERLAAAIEYLKRFED